jgi:hypothetical protein
MDWFTKVKRALSGEKDANTRDLPTESYNERHLAQDGIHGQQNSKTNTIAYPFPKKFYEGVYAPGAPVRVHEWRHWQQYSRDDVANDYLNAEQKKEPYEVRPIEADAQATAKRFDKEITNNFHANRNKFIQQESTLPDSSFIEVNNEGNVAWPDAKKTEKLRKLYPESSFTELRKDPKYRPY